LGIIAGWLVFRYETRRNRYLQERLDTIAEVNHHVRNALQVISYSATEARLTGDVASRLEESSQRIQWALREVLGKDTAA
jgi:two-component sensor histidine kinase